MIDWQSNGLIAHNLDRPKGLIECESVIDVGAGLRPMQWYEPKSHICVEPHQPYADRLIGLYGVVVADAKTALSKVSSLVDSDTAIYLLDVIEHMTREDGFEVIRLALALQPRQIVVFTPFGFMEQHGDAWGLGGDYWQEHRSGWTPDDFPGWVTEQYGRGFFATWTRPASTPT